MPHLPTDFPLTVWPCYEPASHRVELTAADLVQHILLLGSTGSGNSRQLIAHQTRWSNWPPCGASAVSSWPPAKVCIPSLNASALASHCPSDEREDYTFRTLSLRLALGGQIGGAGHPRYKRET